MLLEERLSQDILPKLLLVTRCDPFAMRIFIWFQLEFKLRGTIQVYLLLHLAMMWSSFVLLNSRQEFNPVY